MKEFIIGQSLVCYDDWDIENKPDLYNFIKSQDLINLVAGMPEDVIVVLGGDGSMLNIIGKYHDDGRAFLGINFGHKGFLLNNRVWIDLDSSFITRHYPLLEVKQNGESRGVSFNDVNIYSPYGKVIELNVSRKDIGKINFRGDGLIVATPAGSTGHSRSYKGPSLPHNSNAIIITPKGNIDTESPKTIPGNDNTIIIKNIGRKFDLAVNIDGNLSFTSKSNEDISIEIKKTPSKIKLLISKEHEQDWDNKVMQAQGFR